jgi:hypothetical protein
MALPADFFERDPRCPGCGSAVYDNRRSKKNHKQPDARCKNDHCDFGNGGKPWAGWLADRGQQAPAPPHHQPQQSPPAAQNASQPYKDRRVKPLPFDEWVRVTREVLVQMHAACVAVRGEATDDTLIEQACSLVRTYWVDVKDGITYPEGYAPDSGVDAKAPADSNGGAPDLLKIIRLYGSLLQQAITEEEIDAAVVTIRADAQLSAPQRTELFKLALNKKAEMMGEV